mmetsp:Transcript_15301/g.36371  ORF Transcript_15301/g.36371 Transcript_15301/m.36371 type:complete len:218 (-) Transcript_15301:423-1076(-)
MPHRQEPHRLPPVLPFPFALALALPAALPALAAASATSSASSASAAALALASAFALTTASASASAASMAAALLRREAAVFMRLPFCAGAVVSCAVRSKCVAASLRSAAERGPDSQAVSWAASTSDRILCPTSLSVPSTTVFERALRASSFHHSGLATSAHSSTFRLSKAAAMESFYLSIYLSAQPTEPPGYRAAAWRKLDAASAERLELARAAPRLK